MKLFVAILLWWLPLLAQGPSFFIQLSDPQLGMFAKNENMLQDEANFRFVTASINRLKPAFVVVTGDLVNKPGDGTQIQRYLEIVRSIDPGIPVYNVAGNHDVESEPTPASLAVYRKSIGKDYYAFDAGVVRGIVLNSSLIQHPNNSPDEAAKQESWLVDQLKRARAEKVENVMVFQHISYFLDDPNEPDQYFNIPTATRKKYLDLFHEYGVKHVFAGHYHRNALGHDGDLEMVTTGPVGLPLGKDQSGIRVVRLNGGTVEHHYFELGSIPNAISPAATLPVFPAH